MAAWNSSLDSGVNSMVTYYKHHAVETRLRVNDTVEATLRVKVTVTV